MAAGEASPSTLPVGRLMVTCGAAGADPSDTHTLTHTRKDTHKDGVGQRNAELIVKISCFYVNMQIISLNALFKIMIFLCNK